MGASARSFERDWRSFAQAFEAEDNEGALEALRRWIDSWDRCFWASDFTAFPIAYWPDVEIINRTRIPGVPKLKGIDGFRQLRGDAADVMSNFRFEVTRFHRAGERFVGVGRIQARGRYSGLLIRLPLAVMWTYRDGRIAQVEAYTSRRKALAALGGAPREVGSAS